MSAAVNSAAAGIAATVSKAGAGMAKATGSPQMLGRAVAVMIGIILFIIFCLVVFALVVQEAAQDPRVSDPLVQIALKNRQEDIVKMQLSGINSLFNGINQPNSPVYLTKNEQFLINLCPLTASLGGFIGPLKEGVFDVSNYLTYAFNAGIRSFVLPISVYYDDNKYTKNWPLSGTPAIVHRNQQGSILSLNGLKLIDFCNTLVQKKSINHAQADEPIILYLHGVKNKIPNPKEDEAGYVKFTSMIAEGLEPLKQFRLQTLQTIGSVVGGANQDKILTQVPLSELRRRILIFTNFNVNLGLKTVYKAVNPKLSDYANFVYSPLTSSETSTKLCRSIHMADVTAEYTDKYRTSWLMTLEDDLSTIQTPKDVNNAINITVQCIPMPFISAYMPADAKKPTPEENSLTFSITSRTVTTNADTNTLDAVYKQWGGYAFRVRQGEYFSKEGFADQEGFAVVDAPKKYARFSKPEEIVPMKPSASLNARIVLPEGVPPLPPGQLKIN
jgi:hypothetical protein